MVVSAIYRQAVFMIISEAFVPRAQGRELDINPQSFGELRESSDLLGDPAALRSRILDDGYLFLRGFLNRDDVLTARKSVVDRMASNGLLEPGSDPMDGIVRDGVKLTLELSQAQKNAALAKILYSGRMMEFYRSMFGEEVLHFDFTWFRAIGPGLGTPPHCDMVYMGRGTRDHLFTAWVPIGDVPIELGGLMMLEGSHQQQERLRHYLERDVDTYCTNGRHATNIETGRKQWEWDGWLAKNPVSLREKLGGRWLTTSYRAGDLLTFPMHMVHASLDNPTRRVRLSSDSRYQPASLPADARWIGENPVGHTLAGKRGRIC